MSNRKPRGKTLANKMKKEIRKYKLKKELIVKKITGKILKYNDLNLKTACEEVLPTDNVSFIKDMKVVLKSTKNGVGIAANQIGILKRVVVLYPKRIEMMVMINPEIEIIEEKDDDTGEMIVKKYEHEEGCLSYPNFYTKIKRPRNVKVKYYDENLKEQNVIMNNFESSLVQHEVDHLSGKCLVGDAWEIKQERKDKIYFRKSV